MVEWKRFIESLVREEWSEEDIDLVEVLWVKDDAKIKSCVEKNHNVIREFLQETYDPANRIETFFLNLYCDDCNYSENVARIAVYHTI